MMSFQALLAETYLSWMPAYSLNGFVVLLSVSALTWVCLRIFWGPSKVRPRIELWLLRGCSLAIVAAILLGPTMVEEHAGELSRPSMLYLFDGSESMRLGQDETRWQESLRFIAEAEQAAGTRHVSDCQAFRFGHRLLPLVDSPAGETGDEPADNMAAVGGPPITAVSGAGTSLAGGGRGKIEPPSASDSRLGDALRQLLPQVSAKSSAGVVLLSDGRVRASESVERLAEFFGKSGVPLHVVPIGQATGTGDIAVVSLVVPTRVRKYTENELQVFLRSFGFTGQRTVVRVISRNKIGASESATLASMPITLSGGAQSVPLTFRVNEQPEDLEIVVDPIEGELTERNNRVSTRVEIDRTKVRVLYVDSDGSVGQQQSVLGRIFSFGAPQQRSGAPADLSTVQQALQADEDVECTVLVSVGGSAPRVVSQNANTSSIGFPKTRAELFAYDCVVFSNVGPNVLEPEQTEWLAQWIEGRGGGLIITGGDALRAPAWKDSPLLPMLPLTLDTVQATFAQPLEVDVSQPRHAIWRLRLEENLNAELLGHLPPLSVSGMGYQPKSTAQVLARRRDDGSALVMEHRVGRGRVLVSAAALGGRSLGTMADTWGPQPERVAAKFWRNMVYWATEGSSTGRRRLVAESDKRFYRPGEPLSVFATAYDEGARQTQKYRVWAMFEPSSLDDMSLYSPILWPDNVARDSGEVGPRIAWGEELRLNNDVNRNGYLLNMMLSEASGVGDSGLRIEMTAYEGAESGSAFDHGTQVDSTSLAIQVLSDPFEQQNPLPNHELMKRLAAVSGGQVLEYPNDLADLLKNRKQTIGPPKRETSPAWSDWWLWLCLLGLLSTEWIWRRVTGLA
jgi:uncharacterized membrane protein